MAKDKNPSGEQSSSPIAGPTHGPKDTPNEEIERRVAALEKSTTDLNKRIFDSHKWFVTVLFSAVAVLLGVYGVMSRLDVRDSTNDREKKVDKATGEMEKKFAELSGEALKKPLLEIYTVQGLLDGQVFEISQNSALPIYPLFFKNIGDKRTEPLSIQLSFTSDVFMNGTGPEWQRTATDDKDYPFNYNSGAATYSRAAGIGIAPQETWPLQAGFLNQVGCPITNIVKCKFKVFYGADKPAEAKFVIKFK